MDPTSRAVSHRTETAFLFECQQRSAAQPAAVPPVRSSASSGPQLSQQRSTVQPAVVHTPQLSQQLGQQWSGERSSHSAHHGGQACSSRTRRPPAETQMTSSGSAAQAINPRYQYLRRLTAISETVCCLALSARCDSAARYEVYSYMYIHGPRLACIQNIFRVPFQYISLFSNLLFR